MAQYKFEELTRDVIVDYLKHQKDIYNELVKDAREYGNADGEAYFLNKWGMLVDICRDLDIIAQDEC